MEQWRMELYHSELYHHGIKGMKWGRRRYQNPDGTLTPLGRKRLGYTSTTTMKYKEKYGADSNKYKRSAELDRKIGQKMLSDVTTNRGHGLAKSILLGPTGAMTYNMARAAGYSKGRAFIKSCFDISAGGLVESAALRAGNKLASNAASHISDDNPHKDKISYGLKVAGSVAGRTGAEVASAKLRDTGAELSLQQRAIRRHYVNGDLEKAKQKKEADERRKENIAAKKAEKDAAKEKYRKAANEYESRSMFTEGIVNHYKNNPTEYKKVSDARKEYQEASKQYSDAKRKKDYTKTVGYALATSPAGQLGLKAGQAIQRQKLEKEKRKKRR